MAQPLVVFKAISSASDQQLLFQRVLAEETILSLKDSKNNEIFLKPMSVNSQLQFKCHNLNAVRLSDENTNHVMTFTVDGEKYLCDAQVRLHNDLALVSTLNLFHLQKRRHFRYSIPKNYAAYFHATLENFKTFQAKIIDLNTEGCALEISQEDVDVVLNASLRAEIKVPGKKPVPILGTLRNIRAQGPTLLILGVEFNHLGNNGEQDIVTLLTEIQREVYLKKSA